MIRYLAQDLAGPRTLVRVLASAMRARTLAVVLFRLAQLVGARCGLLADAIKQVNQMLTGADVAWEAQIGPGLVLYHPQGVVIGPGVRIGSLCEIQQGVTIGTKWPTDDAASLSPTLGDGCLLGAGSRVVGPIVLGSGAVVGANAVCTRSVPDAGIVVGVPARLVGKR